MTLANLIAAFVGAILSLVVGAMPGIGPLTVLLSVSPILMKLIKKKPVSENS